MRRKVLTLSRVLFDTDVLREECKVFAFARVFFARTQLLT